MYSRGCTIILYSHVVIIIIKNNACVGCYVCSTKVTSSTCKRKTWIINHLLFVSHHSKFICANLLFCVTSAVLSSFLPQRLSERSSCQFQFSIQSVQVFVTYFEISDRKSSAYDARIKYLKKLLSPSFDCGCNISD